MPRKKSTVHLLRDIVGSFIEEVGADAVVVVYSKVKGRKTETYLVPYGNAHTCNALIDYAYEHYEANREDDGVDLEIEEEEDDDE